MMTQIRRFHDVHPARMIRHTAIAALAGGVLALASIDAHADVAACRALTGFDTAAGGIVTGTGAWATVTANRASFLSNNMVDNCAVQVVTSLAKGAPVKTIYFAGPMTSDECSMYRFLSSIDSKLALGKTSDALTVDLAMISKVDTIALAAPPKLVEPGYSAIRGAAVGIQECIALLL